MAGRELLSHEEIDRVLASELSRWTREGDAIVRSVHRASFAEAIELVTAVAAVAEELDHHPDIDVRWTTVRFRSVTHSAGGLTRLDLRLAAEIDRLAS